MTRLQTIFRFLRGIISGLPFLLGNEALSEPSAPTTAPISKVDLPPRVFSKEPNDAVRTFQCSEGFRMDLIAAEPLVMSPVSICYDENGNMYVAEMTDYPYPEEGRANGRIRLVRDLDGDGKFDTSSIFVDGLRSPSSLVCWKGGIFVSTHGEIWYFKGSGSSTTTPGPLNREVLSTRTKVLAGFGLGSLEYMQNGLIWGVDHKIYGAAGPNGGAVQRVGYPAEKPVSLGGRDFRFDPETLIIESISGPSQWGNTFDDSYNRFVCRNIAPARHIVLPLQYLARNPFLKVPRLYHALTSEEGDVPVYRASPPEAWRVARARLRQELGKNANPGEINEAGYFTAACGITVYRGAAYPESYGGNLFIAEPAGNLVHRRALQPDGVTFTSRRVDENSEVIASTDIFFRPVNFVNAPDGTLHIVDMYRELVEDPKYVPSDLIAAGKVDVQGGKERGRIYRLTPPNFIVPKPPRLGAASTLELVAQLENSNAWWRETAQRLIYERQDRAAITSLRKFLAESPRPLARLHALWALDGLNALTTKELSTTLIDRSLVVREHSLRLAGQRIQNDSELLSHVLSLANDSEPRVRFQLALTLGEAGKQQPQVMEKLVTALAEIVRRDASDIWIRTAILSASADCADKLFGILFREDEGKSLLKELAFTVGCRSRREEVESVLSTIAAAGLNRDESASQVGFVAALSQGLKQSGSDLFQQLCADASAPAGRVVSGALNIARAVCGDTNAPIDLRKDAAGLLAYGDLETARIVLTSLLRPDQPEELQSAAVRALANYRDRGMPAILLRHWRGLPPLVQGEILDAILAREEWIDSFFSAVDNETVPFAMIGAVRRTSLLNHSESSIRQRAAELFGTVKAQPRDVIIEKYKSVALLAGDRVRGREVFERACVTCHRFAGKGNNIGPNLSAYGQPSQSPEKLLISILDPNREVSPDYTAYVVELTDGQSLTGIIETQTNTSITFKQPGNTADLVILRSNIKEMKSGSISLMPEGFEESINPLEMADLLAFLTAIRGGI